LARSLFSPFSTLSDQNLEESMQKQAAFGMQNAKKTDAAKKRPLKTVFGAKSR
jgi:hypothetical protein